MNMINEYDKLIKDIIENPIQYTKRAQRDIERAHFDDDRLRKVLLNPRKVDICSDNVFIVYGVKTAKVKVESIEGKYILVHWFEYNKVPMII